MAELGIAKLIGEGVERPEGTLPLDINYAKLAEWLVTRQKIPRDWHKRHQVIQAKAAEALKEVPQDVLNNLTEGQDAPLDYLRAVEIRDRMVSTAERTMFGGLIGPASTWDKIVKAYEKQCQIALAAPILLPSSGADDFPYTACPGGGNGCRDVPLELRLLPQGAASDSGFVSCLELRRKEGWSCGVAGGACECASLLTGGVRQLGLRTGRA
ncbi:CDK5RAP3-like protein [Tetrabaena socialis]|uniref:CDK5RAP3-like protein n=1 Tax=Tetrabaena socialis TaxID=47790 RepID=A0A2J7ZWS5_9CHLO|nr:CDK5RAP3-like protein [Tetrabaena socialis]|eukprot:PNH04719.1 CDK5RAP3-like protein [Tetrabaena socialis]